MSLALHLRGKICGPLQPGLYKVLNAREAIELRVPLERVLIDFRSGCDVEAEALRSIGVGGALRESEVTGFPLPFLQSLSIAAAVNVGDVIRLQPSGKINVLFRRGANANTLFLTENCNSLCVMCSQPPREVDDSWRVDEILDLLPLIDHDLDTLGLTGGEPTLLGGRLVELLEAGMRSLPTTTFHILTNGRRFLDREFAAAFDKLRGRVTWAVPLYADNARLHDEVVGSKGAFSETMHGLHNLAEYGHSIELRTVLHGMTLPRITQLCEFISRNLPFVQHVALMGMEPMGLARTNAPRLRYDPERLGPTILAGTSRLHQAGLRVSLYNIPLCMLDPVLRPFAKKSISDWKNEFAAACEDCALKDDCCGFFRSADQEWRRRVAHPQLATAAA
ncbi:His-Xaa-Ser system radical SAM maturase HxsC [Bradyrhizobium sp. G127]|uniref:His-Xaa-Ser system radical SAM maturase HxsC n=1 Tax=Bradyrhizobium sp. G127 TaxID=2904800 RepID=UPI001BC36D4C|nr:His-Xaa-Ser system radical SAM maturase HxsC [Bradyrhizobium sp. G127]MBS4004966.1 His-Xaa-Ser system radical SAM maturase HxsC [Afipia sp.]MCF2521637.1 His-Xaa-Ser system radical SAM maturase HxsC [Bradyrhizobium sp. G127]